MATICCSSVGHKRDARCSVVAFCRTPSVAPESCDCEPGGEPSAASLALAQWRLSEHEKRSILRLLWDSRREWWVPLEFDLGCRYGAMVRLTHSPACDICSSGSRTVAGLRIELQLRTELQTHPATPPLWWVGSSEVPTSYASTLTSLTLVSSRRFCSSIRAYTLDGIDTLHLDTAIAEMAEQNQLRRR